MPTPALPKRGVSIAIFHDSLGQGGILESLLEIGVLEGQDHFVQVAFHHAVEIIKGQADAVISDPVLRKIVGSDFFFAPSGANLTLASGGIFGFLLPLLVLEQAGPEDTERLFLILLLTAAVLATDDSAGWNVHHLDRRIGRVDPLAARSASAANFDAKILGLQFEIDLLGFWEYSHRCGGSVNATLGFGGRHALHTMDTTLVTQLAEN